MDTPSDLHFPSRADLDGPWLFSKKALEELDAIIYDHWCKLEKRREALLRQDTEEFRKTYAHMEKQYRKEVNRQIRDHEERSLFSRRWKVLHVYLKDSARYSYENFGAAFLDGRLLRETPTGFALDIFSGEIRCEVNVGVYSSDLRIRIEPDDIPEAQETYTSVHEWARELQRQVWGRRIWGRVANYSRTILVLGLLLYGLLFFGTQETNLAATRDQLSALYQRGITDKNVTEAVKLLARLQTSELVVTPWLIAYPISYIYMAIALYARPRVVIGIGRGRDWLMFWKVWQVVILAPVLFVIVDVVIPYIAELVRSLLLMSQ